MTQQPPRPPAHLPVLTEVLEPRPAPPVIPPTPVAASLVPPVTPQPQAVSHVPVSLIQALTQPEPATSAGDSTVGVEVDLSFPPAPTPPASMAMATPLLDTERLSQRVRANVQLQVDQLLEAKLRETMAPLLAQQADMLVFRLKMELTGWLDDMVARAVAQEVGRKNNP